MNELIDNLKKGIKRVLKLDKNFHVYIHGDTSKIEVSKDEKGQFIKLYFDNVD
jgi:hypothetical protein